MRRQDRPLGAGTSSQQRLASSNSARGAGKNGNQSRWKQRGNCQHLQKHMESGVEARFTWTAPQLPQYLHEQLAHSSSSSSSSNASSRIR